jgi:hypothetical protein
MSDSNWLKEPDPSGDAVVYVSIPEGSKLTPELTEALTRLSGALHDLGKNAPAKTPCNPLRSCTLGFCQPMFTKSCFMYVTCKVQP